MGKVGYLAGLTLLGTASLGVGGASFLSGDRAELVEARDLSDNFAVNAELTAEQQQDLGVLALGWSSLESELAEGITAELTDDIVTISLNGHFQESLTFSRAAKLVDANVHYWEENALTVDVLAYILTVTGIASIGYGIGQYVTDGSVKPQYRKIPAAS